METKHREQLKSTLPPEKLAQKKSDTRTGIMFVIVGVLSAFGSFALTALLLTNGTEVTKWVVILVAIPFVGGCVLCVIGGHVWSGELVDAALKDVGSTVTRVMRRKTNGNGSP